MAAKFPQKFEIQHREADLIDEALTHYASLSKDKRRFGTKEIRELQKLFGAQLYMGSDR